MRAWAARLVLVPAAFALVAADELKPADFAADARSIETIVNKQYAYLDRFPGGRMPMTAKLRAEASAVSTARELVRYSERALALLADHHAITGSSTKESRAVVPSYSDLWVERQGKDYVVEQVRADTPASQAGIRAGDRLDLGRWRAGGRRRLQASGRISGRQVAESVTAMPRGCLLQDAAIDQGRLSCEAGTASPRSLTLPNLYSRDLGGRPLLSAVEEGNSLVLRIDDSSGNRDTVAVFDQAMARARPGQAIVIDLTTRRAEGTRRSRAASWAGS